MRRVLWTIPFTLIVLAIVYLTLGYPPLVIRWTAIDVNSGRTREMTTLCGFTASDQIKESKASRFIEINLPPCTTPHWMTCSQHRPFDSATRCYFGGPQAALTYRDLMESFETFDVPRTDQVRLMQAARDAVNAGKWIFVKTDRDEHTVQIKDEGSETGDAIAEWRLKR